VWTSIYTYMLISDSMYLACSAPSLEDAVTPDRKALFDELKVQFLALNKDPFSPGYDQRKPGE
jgi:hypothetical protein